MSHKSHRLDLYFNNGFQSVEMNAYSKTECRRHDPYLPLSILMGRTCGSHCRSMLIFNGLIRDDYRDRCYNISRGYASKSVYFRM